MRSIGASAAIKWGNRRYLELDYADLLCTGEALGGRGALPRFLGDFAGLGACTPAEHAAAARGEAGPASPRGRRALREKRWRGKSGGAGRLPPPLQPPPSPPPDETHGGDGGGPSAHGHHAVKTSPASPAAELVNVNELRDFGRRHSAPWLQNRLDLHSETQLRNCSAATADPAHGPPTPAARGRPSLSSGTVAQTQGKGTNFGATPSTHSPQMPLLVQPSRYTLADLEVLAAPARQAHFRAELQRLHQAYVDLAASKPKKFRTSGRWAIEGP